MAATGTINEFTKQNLSDIIPKAMDILSRILDKSGEKKFIDKKTKILMANNNEIEDGKHRFHSNGIRKMLRNLGFNEQEIEEHLIVYEEREILYTKTSNIYNFLMKLKILKKGSKLEQACFEFFMRAEYEREKKQKRSSCEEDLPGTQDRVQSRT